MELIKLILKNYMAHEYLKLDFSDNINVITGLSGKGKSCIFRSLEWLHGTSDISETDFRREGTKETSVKGCYDSGIQIERIRSKSINRYILSKEGCEDKVFDSVGKNIPEEIAELLGFREIDIDNEHLNLNFASQDQLNFILDPCYSDGFKAKLFNKLTGNELIDVLFKDCNKEALQLSRKIKTIEETIEKQEEELVFYSEDYRKAKAKLKNVNDLFSGIEEKNERCEELYSIIDRLKEIKQDEEFIEFQKSKIKVVDEKVFVDLKIKAKRLSDLKTVIDELNDVNYKLNSIHESIDTIKTVDVDFEALEDRAERLSELKELIGELNKIKDEEEKVTNKQVQIKKLYGNTVKELKELWKNNPVCPLCGEVKK